jgi:hypothetical protein
MISLCLTKRLSCHMSLCACIMGLSGPCWRAWSWTGHSMTAGGRLCIRTCVYRLWSLASPGTMAPPLHEVECAQHLHRGFTGPCHLVPSSIPLACGVMRPQCVRQQHLNAICESQLCGCSPLLTCCAQQSSNKSALVRFCVRARVRVRACVCVRVHHHCFCNLPAQQHPHSLAMRWAVCSPLFLPSCHWRT